MNKRWEFWLPAFWAFAVYYIDSMENYDLAD